MCDYFDKLVCTTNPDPAFTINILHHPCAKKIPLGSNVEDDDTDYASLVNFVTRHTKCGTYFLRKSKITKKHACRFIFPRELSDASKIVEESPNSNIYRFVGRINDIWVNSHNRAVLHTWRGNIDWYAVTAIDSITQYISKYAAKFEPDSKNYNDTLCGIVDDKLRHCLDSTYAIKWLIIKSASDRDISAQEVFHLLMGWHLTESSRKVVLLNLSETTKTHHFDHGKWKKYRVGCVVRIVPEIGGKVMPNTDQYESFCRQQDGNKSVIPPSNKTKTMVEDESEEEIDPRDETLEEEWMVTSRMAPNFGTIVDIELDLRSIDKNHYLEEGFRSFPLTEEDRAFTSRLGEAGHEVHSSIGTDTSLTVLSAQQKASLNLVQKSLNDGLRICLIVSGGAGTGKSTLINTIVRSTREMFGNDKDVRIMAPTGVATFNIGDSTIHHELSITTNRNQSYKKFETQRCGRMQVDFSGTKLIIIDEYSIIAKRMLGNIDLRCRDIFATDEPLPPLFDSPLYAQGGRDRDLELTCYAAYSEFDHCVHLKEVFRQSGIAEQQFREALLSLSDGKYTIEDWELFKSREYLKLTGEEKYNFKNAIHLFPIKDAAASYNYKQLEKLGYPVAHVVSSNNHQIAEHASTDDAKGLHKIVLLFKESRVMLKKNICTKFCLVNGSTGTVVDVRKQFPLILCWAIMVHKIQGLTLDQAAVDIEAKESLGLTFVALLRTRRLSDLAFDPMFSLERIAKIGECKELPERIQEEKRLQELSQHCRV
ncbi:hypothetical protein MKX03_009388 [Papaver bracteatum]|nr:hypothetical protein MKX03_009388 [Papaver bracteatum]